MVPSTAQPGIHPIILDLTDPTTFTPLIDALASLPLDFLFNVAGTMAPKEQDTLTTTTLAILQMTFATDTFGPLLLTQQLLPNLLASPSPRIYNVSSRVGSIADDSTGGSYAYRASKAALNSISKSMAVDMKEKGVVVLMLHPGIVKTGLVQTSHSAEGAVEPDVAAWELWAVCKAKGMEGSGKFWHRTGGELPW